MVDYLSVSSPGKINLRLDVIGKRSDGYHDLVMLMERINLCDEIRIKIVEKGITVKCNHKGVPLGEQNTVFKAVKEILAYYSRNIGVEVDIDKKIPVAAGMGGGSSNAAAVLKGLNQLLKLKLPREKLMKIGTKIGADVPFFLFDAPAIATGIGDQLKKVKKIPKMTYVVVNPGISVSTEWVYKKLGLNGAKPGASNLKVHLPDSFPTKQAVAKVMKNDLEKVTAQEYPIISELKKMLLAHGAIASQMTGSGPTVFGIFPDRTSVDKAIAKIEHRGEKDWNVFGAESFPRDS